MPEKANSIMIFNQKEFKLLGGKYKDKFKVGQYVEYRRVCRNENYEESVKVYHGIIINLRTVDIGGRIVWYADVLKNGGDTDLILLSQIRKIQTN
jgi:hypothetical protein